MTIEKLKRVLIRIRQMYPYEMKHDQRIGRILLRRAVMIECGTSPQTYYNNVNALKLMGWIKWSRGKWKLTGKDLTEEFDYF